MWLWKLLTFLHATLNYRPGTILFFTYKIICYFSLPFSRCEIWSSKGLLTCPRTQLPNAEQRFKSRHSGSNLYSKPLYIYTCTTRLREGNGSPLWCSCLENPRDGGAWWVAVYGVAHSWTWLKWLSSSRSHFLLWTSLLKLLLSHPMSFGMLYFHLPNFFF